MPRSALRRHRRGVGRWTVTRLAVVALLASLVVSALIGIGIILQGEFGETQGRLLGTTAALAAFSLISLPSLLHFERGRYRPLSATVILSSLASFVMVVALIWWEDSVEREVFLKTLGTLAVVALSASHVSLMLLARARERTVRICLRATIAAIAVLASLLILVIWTEDIPDAMQRVLGTVLILDALGTIAVPVLARLNRAAPSRRAR